MPKITFVTIPNLRVASIELVGSYHHFGEGLSELSAWLESREISADGPPMGLFYDNPLEIPTDMLRCKACIPIRDQFTAEGKFNCEDLPGGLVAKTRHEGKPEQYTRTYGAFLESLLNSGYDLMGPAREVFERVSTDLQPGMGVEIQQPVAKRNQG